MALTKISKNSIADDAIDSEHYVNASIDAAHIANNTITATQIATGAVDTSELAADSVTGAKIADDAVGAEHIEDLDADVKWLDNQKAIFGTGSDLKIYHESSSTTNWFEAPVGDVKLQCTDGDIYLNPKAGETGVKVITDGAIELYHNNELKLSTSETGVDIQDATATSVWTKFSNSSGIAGYIYGNGATEIGFLDGQQHWTVKSTKDGSVDLHHNNNLRLSTHLNGTQFVGSLGLGVAPAQFGTGVETIVFKGTGDTKSGCIDFKDGDDGARIATIFCENDTDYGLSIGTYGETADFVRFHTGALGSERMRITSGGQLNIGTTVDALAVDTGNNTGINLTGTGRIYVKSNDHSEVNIIGGGEAIRFRYGYTDGTTQADAGSIDITGTNSTAYNTSSDYRLKENQVAITNAITRLKLLKPYRFNFKSEPSKTVDGFFAHEVTPAVPEAITGEKDGERMQGIDQSKLVPLLTAALQGAVAKIETLETKVTALEAK